MSYQASIRTNSLGKINMIHLLLLAFLSLFVVAIASGVSRHDNESLAAQNLRGSSDLGEVYARSSWDAYYNGKKIDIKGFASDFESLGGK